MQSNDSFDNVRQSIEASREYESDPIIALATKWDAAHLDSYKPLTEEEKIEVHNLRALEQVCERLDHKAFIRDAIYDGTEHALTD